GKVRRGRPRLQESGSSPSLYSRQGEHDFELVLSRPAHASGRHRSAEAFDDFPDHRKPQTRARGAGSLPVAFEQMEPDHLLEPLAVPEGDSCEAFVEGDDDPNGAAPFL